MLIEREYTIYPSKSKFEMKVKSRHIVYISHPDLYKYVKVWNSPPKSTRTSPVSVGDLLRIF